MRVSRPIAMLALPVLALLATSDPTATGADEASKSPKQILADVARDLAKVRTYHVEETDVDKDGRTQLVGDVTASGSVRIRAATGKERFFLTVVGSRIYLKGNAAYWKAEGGLSSKDAAKIANRWVKMSVSGAGDLKTMLEQLTPKGLAYCATRSSGTLTKAGTESLNGRRAIVLVDKGDRPGTSPGRLYVAASGPVLPLREVQTGPQKRGGKPDPRCSDSDSTTKSADLRFSAYNKPVKITAPKGAIDLERSTGTPAAA
jgi:hypothetical protein